MDNAIAQVDVLRHDINLSDGQPAIVPTVNPIQMRQTQADTTILASPLFVGVDDTLIQQAQLSAQLETSVKKAQQYLHVLYAARSLSKAIPQLQNSHQPNKEKLYEESIKILQPEVDRMHSFFIFQEEAINQLCQSIAYLAETFIKAKRDLSLAPEGLITSVIRLFGILFTVDNLKNVKSSWSNDLSAYKRACSNLRRMDGINIQQQQQLIFFLANNNVIINNTKSRLEEITHFKEVLVYITHICLDRHDHHNYITPGEKHMLLKFLTISICKQCMMFTVFAMDGVDHQARDKDNKNSILRVKKLKLERILKLFKRWPVIPLVGDMHIDTSAIFRLAPHINDAKVSLDDSDEINLSRKYEIQYNMKNFQIQYQELMSELALFEHEHAGLQAGDSTAYDLIFKALRTLGDWTIAVHEQAAWKHAHPTDEYINRECPTGCTSYEKAERSAMVELLAMIIDIRGKMARMSSKFIVALNTYIHNQVQAALHGVFQPLLQLANKKKRRDASRVLATITNLVSDLEVTVSAAAIHSQQLHVPVTKRDAKKLSRQAALPDTGILLPVRVCGPTSAQLFFLQGVVNTLLHADNGGLLKGKDFSPQQIDVIKSLNNRISFFYDLLDFNNTLDECGDLSALWYKEFHLELSKEIQFPVEFSLPWILTSATLSESVLHEHVMIPFELYNDAAQHALFKLKSQTLYREIEAEVNLCFDQLMFQLSEQVFVNFKSKATSMYLPREAKESPIFHNSLSSLDVHDIMYKSVLQQRHVRLLGRAIDLSDLISQGLDALMKRTISMAIQVFEAEDICSIVAFQRMLEIEEMTHKLMSEYFTLTPFKDMLDEQNGSMNPASNYGRIEHKIIFEVLSDLTTNFAYNFAANEFRRPALVFAEQQERDSHPKVSAIHMFGNKALANAMQALLDTTKSAFRLEHASAIVRLFKQQRMAALINELSQTVGLALHTVVRPFVSELVKGLPKIIKEPDSFYGREGAFLYYQAMLKPILQYPDLSTEVYQEFRNIGNTLCLTAMLEQALGQIEDVDSLVIHPFRSYEPRVRRLRMPTQEQLAGRVMPFGLQLSGGHSEPVIISEVSQGSVAGMAGFRANDEVLAVGQTSFRQPKGEEGPAFIPHDAAINILRQCLGHEVIVQNTQREPFTESVKLEMEQLSKACEVDFLERGRKSLELYQPIASFGSILRGALQIIDNLLDETGLRKEWASSLETDQVYSENPALFHRLWSAINFAQCIPSSTSTYSTEMLFGQGLHWGGLMLVYLLGQSRAFEVYHYVYSWLNINETGAVAVTTSGDTASVGPINLDEFARLAIRQRDLNTKIFKLFRIFYPFPDDRSGDNAGVCTPPRSSDDTGHYYPSARERSELIQAAESNI
eukprot:gene5755-223_t